ncbi:WAS/WASL-interacting protein family member 1 [Procambarus clarkii]
MSRNPPAPARVPPPPPVRRDSAIHTSSSFSDEPNTLPRQLETIEDDQDPYDEVEESQQMSRPPVPSNKPSFLHSALKPSQSVRSNSPNSNLPASSGPKEVGGRQWPPPKPQLPSKPPPSDTKPSGSTFSADDDEDIYETIEEP